MRHDRSKRRLTPGLAPLLLATLIAVVPGLAATPQAWALTADERDERLGQVRAMIGRAGSGLQASIGSWVGREPFVAAAAVYNHGWLFLSEAALTSAHLHALVADAIAVHELWRPTGATTLADFERERQRQLLTANARAVEILAQTTGTPEREALRAVYRWLLDEHEAVAAGRKPAPGRVAPCDEMRDLLARYARHALDERAPSCGEPRSPASTAAGAPSMLLVMSPTEGAPPPPAPVESAAQPGPAPATQEVVESRWAPLAPVFVPPDSPGVLPIRPMPIPVPRNVGPRPPSIPPITPRP